MSRYPIKYYLKVGWMKLLLLGVLATPLWAAATCLDQERLTGVNLSGAEFNSSKLPGTPYKDYTFPTEAELTYIAAQGANVIRLPFRWERIQPTPKGELAAAEMKRLQNTVVSANTKGLCVILDMHNYAKYFSQTLNGDAALQNAFVDVWKRLAVVFNDPKQTVFGLMNEPSYLPREEWASLAKRTLNCAMPAQPIWCLLRVGIGVACTIGSRQQWGSPTRYFLLILKTHSSAPY
jgi:endoglucanase